MNLGVLGSGSGTNFAAIADAIADGRIQNVSITCVISDVPDAGILEKAETRGIHALYLPADNFKTKLEGPQEMAYIDALKKSGVEYIALAGFMRMIKKGFLDAFPQRVVNIHPSLLPAFPGLHSWQQAWEYGARVAGCTVHFVDAGMDTGPIIAQAAVPVKEDDTPETLHARIQKQEHILYPKVIQWLAAGFLTVDGRRVYGVPEENTDV